MLAKAVSTPNPLSAGQRGTSHVQTQEEKSPPLAPVSAETLAQARSSSQICGNNTLQGRQIPKGILVAPGRCPILC